MDSEIKSEAEDYLSVEYLSASEDRDALEDSLDSFSDDQKKQVECIKCGTQLEQMEKFTIDTEIQDLIKEWIAPKELLHEHILCTDCWTTAYEKLDEEGSGKDSKLGVTFEDEDDDDEDEDLCVSCCKSLYMKPFVKYDVNSTQDAYIWEDLANRIALNKLNDKICYSCWGKSKRSAKSRLSDLEDPSYKGPSVQKPDNSIKPEEFINLPNYSRTPLTKYQCIHPDCKDKDGDPVPKWLRQQLLNKHNYFVYNRATLCSRHFADISMECLVKRDIQHFSPDAIEDVLTLNSHKKEPDNFNRLMDMDDNLVLYWTGLPKEEFHKLSINIPGLTDLKNGILGLAAYLMRIHTGDSVQRISSLMNVTQVSLEESLTEVTKLIDKTD